MPEHEPSITKTNCAQCGAAIPPGAPFGQCPRCLLGLGSSAGLGGEVNAIHIRSFGDYELLEEIARGGMGVVYRARQLSLGREVALKMILAGELATPESVQRFRNEASAAARLDHPNIVPVYEIGEHDTQHYFSMRLVPGRRNIATWAKALSQPAAVPIAVMMAKVARAVAFAHERGVLHRDLKPSNILIDDKAEPQVTDFGLAKLVNEHDSALTLSVAMMGSPSYMAPEQADGRHGDVTTATDVHGLGAVLYELLAGRPPFVGPSPLAIARNVVEQPPPPLAGAPRDIAIIGMKCLAKEPLHRYASAQELADDLERFARGESIHARSVTLPEAVWRWARRHPVVAGLLASLVLAFIVGFTGVTWQWQRAEHARKEQQRSLDHLAWEEIARQAGGDEAPVALARLGSLLRSHPGRWQAAMLAMSVVDQSSFPMLAGPPVMPDVKLITPPRLSPDGSWFGAAGDDKTVRAWRSDTGLECAHIAMKATATALAVGEGKLVLAVASDDRALSAWSALDAAAIGLTRRSSAPISDLQFSADGSHLFARTTEGVEVWLCEAPDSPTLCPLAEGCSGAAISSDGSRLLAWNPERAAVFDTTSSKALLEVSGQQPVRRACIAASGSRIALLEGPYIARTWDVGSGRPVGTASSQLSELQFIALNADGSRITLCKHANDLEVIDTASGLKVSSPMLHLYQPTTLVASGDGKCTVSYGYDGRALVWDADSGKSLQSAIWLNTDAAAQVSVSRDGAAILLHPQSKKAERTAVSVWRGTRTRPPQRQPVATQRNFDSNRISPDGRLGCLGLEPDKRAYVYELATGRALVDAPLEGDVYVHLFSPDMHRYYALTANGWLHGWNLDTGKELWPGINQPGKIRPAEISPDGTRIIAGHNDGHIRIYDTASGTLVQTLDHPGEVKTLRFAPDRSGRFISGSTDGIAHLWDLKTGEKLRTFSGHTHTIIASAWSPDSRHFATASYDQTARVWDATTGQPVGRSMPHLAWLSHLEFSPDGSLLATACRDGTARLWHPLTGEAASPALPQGSTAETVRFTRDGACFVVRDHLGFRFWDTAQAEPITIHYPEPVSGGLGMDSESWRALLSPDGTQVHLGYSMNEGALWTLPQPRDNVPAWFPDLLESLALLRVDSDSIRVSSAQHIIELKQQISHESPREPYTSWARRILRLDGGDSR